MPAAVHPVILSTCRAPAAAVNAAARVQAGFRPRRTARNAELGADWRSAACRTSPRCTFRQNRAMDLPAVESRLRIRLAGTLPGADAQIRFAPFPARVGWRAGEFPPEARAAAALLLLYPGGDGVAVPLTVRATTLARHAGQISLPGGATDPGETPRQAALREATEEIGIDPSAVRVLGELTPIHVLVSGFTLHPVVGVTDTRPAFHPAPGEVDEIVEVRLEDLRDASRIRTGSREREGVMIEYPYLDLCGHQVWGATAMVLAEFICLLEETGPVNG